MGKKVSSSTLVSCVGPLTKILRSEQWRYTGPFTRYNRFKRAFPGLGIATVAFAGYLAYEAAFMRDEHHGHGEGHGEEHH
jgi:NADH dehydrogenase (ubiquinone) 1 beta subcomplex subunit 3